MAPGGRAGERGLAGIRPSVVGLPSRPAEMGGRSPRQAEPHGTTAACTLGFRVVISTNQFKNGSHIEIDGKIFKHHRVPARQARQGRGLRADEAAQDRGRLGDRQNLPGRGEVPAGADRVAQDAVPLRLRRRGGLHGQPRLRADRDPDARPPATSMQWVLPNAEVDVLFVDERPERRAGRRARST